jgi:hypothetical protein
LVYQIVVKHTGVRITWNKRVVKTGAQWSGGELLMKVCWPTRELELKERCILSAERDKLYFVGSLMNRLYFVVARCAAPFSIMNGPQEKILIFY